MDSACGNTNTQQLTTWLKKHFRYIFFLLVCVNPKPLILKFPTGVCQRFGLRSAVKVAIGSKGMLPKVLKSIISECCFQYFSLVIFFFQKKINVIQMGSLCLQLNALWYIIIKIRHGCLECSCFILGKQRIILEASR